jgi:hypothetical protein
MESDRSYGARGGGRYEFLSHVHFLRLWHFLHRLIFFEDFFPFTGLSPAGATVGGAGGISTDAGREALGTGTTTGGTGTGIGDVTDTTMGASSATR